MTGTFTRSTSFTITYARYLASKIAADMHLCAAYYGQPSETSIRNYAEELAQYLNEGYLESYEFGYMKNGVRVVTWRYTVDAYGNITTDDRPGKIPPYVDISGATFFNHLSQNSTFFALSDYQQSSFKSGLPVQRTNGYPPSDVIRKIEVPGILKRVREGDGFFLVPVCAGGISYQRAGEVVDQQLSIDNLSDWNLRKVSGDPIGKEEVEQIVRHVLARRIQAIHRQLDAIVPLRLTLHTRARPAFQPGTALMFDWSERFSGRETESSTWQEILLPAVREAACAIRLHGGGRAIIASGLPSIPAATALGAAFLAQAGQTISWSQYTPGRPEQLWSIDIPREAAGFTSVTTEREIAAKDLAVLVSVAEDVEPAFSHTPKANLRPFRAITRICHPDQRRFDITNPGQAADIAATVIEAIRAARDAYRPMGTIHLLMAVPVGLAMLIGQGLNTFGDVQTYEHIPSDGVGIYRAAARLSPST